MMLYGVFVVILSALIFTSVSKLLEPMESLLCSANKSGGSKSWWNTKNTAVSMAHSVISGVLSLWCLTVMPELLTEPFTLFSRLGYFSLCLSEGYFLYDLLDVIVHRHEYKHTLEIVVHHVLIMINIGLSVVECKYIGVVTIGLVTENHNVFLHLRGLLRDFGLPLDSPIYRSVALINVVALILFRFVPYSFLFYHNTMVVVSGEYPYPQFHFFFFWTILFLIFNYTFLLFWRFYKTDFGKVDTIQRVQSTSRAVNAKISRTEFNSLQIQPGDQANHDESKAKSD